MLRLELRVLVASLSFWSSVGCHSLADFDVTYRECVAPGQNYLEEFGAEYQELLDRCWQEDNVVDDAGPRARLLVHDGDLIVRPFDAVVWSDAAQAPFVYRRVESDFVVIARVEAASGSRPDHCLKPDDSAGLVARNIAKTAWTTLLLRPFLEEPNVDCKDEAPNPPRAIAQVRSFGFDPTFITQQAAGIGEDAEADIALCRSHNQLFYFYRDISVEGPQNPWTLSAQQTIGTEAIEIGATTSTTTLNNADTVEGHFNWMAYQIYPGGLPSDGCAGTLMEFEIPEDE